MSRTCRHARSVLARLLLTGITLVSSVSTALSDLTTASSAPAYSAAGIVQAASQTPGALAPNSIVTIYGTNLSWTTHAADSGDLDGRNLPDSLDGVTVYANGLPCGLFFVSPGQVNFIVPYEIEDTSVSITLTRQGVAGPKVTLPFVTGAPGLFQWSGNYAVAQHADGTLISSTSPAHAGEVVVLYATGLGRTSPDIYPGSVPVTALGMLYRSQLQILLNGVPCDQSSIYYAGVTPGFEGLYQINLRLPASLANNPTIQLAMGSQSSPPSVQLFVD